jgi:hypothetical protein
MILLNGFYFPFQVVMERVSRGLKGFRIPRLAGRGRGEATRRQVSPPRAPIVTPPASTASTTKSTRRERKRRNKKAQVQVVSQGQGEAGRVPQFASAASIPYNLKQV